MKVSYKKKPECILHLSIHKQIKKTEIYTFKDSLISRTSSDPCFCVCMSKQRQLINDLYEEESLNGNDEAEIA